MPTPEPVTPPSPVPDNRPLVAIFWMLISGLFFIGVTAVVKHLDGRLPAAQTAFLRYLLGLVFLVPLVPAMTRLRFSRRIWGIFALRGISHALGIILWFYGMATITMAEVTAMNYLTPVYVTLGAALFLGERLQARRLLAVVAALVGAMIILRPGLRPLELGHFAMLGTTLLFSVSFLTAKRLSAVAPPMMVVSVLSVSVTLGTLPFALAAWEPPTFEELAWLFFVAALATVGHYTMTLAFRAGPLSVTQPVTFLQLVWAVSLGAVVFGEPIDGWVVIGGVVIFAAVCFIAIREAQLRAQKAL